MFIATLIASPGELRRPQIETVRNAWGGGDAVWLSGGQAAEFSLEDMPPNLWSVWAGMQSQSVDLIVQPAQNRRKGLLLADMDSTMIEQECIDELAAEAGVGAQVAAITIQAMNGELDFDEALTERIGLLAGLNEAVIYKVLNERISLMPGGAVLLATMKKNGAYAALVSGGFTAFTSAIARQLGFDEHRANELAIKNGKLTGKPVMPILGRQAKIEALQDITARLGIGPNDVIAVGDGANDLGMLGVAGTGVALHAKPSVQKECDVRVNFADLTSLLFIQGYRREEFAS